jgi:hypothetical protein
MPIKAQQLDRQPQSLVSVLLVLLAKALQRRRLRDPYRSGQAAINKRDQAMMLGELKQPLPIDPMSEDLLDASGTRPS